MNLELPKWELVEADFNKFNEFYRTAQRLLLGSVTQEIQRELREFADWSYFPEMAKSSGAWLRVNFPQEIKRILDVGKQVRALLYEVADTSVSVNPGMAEGLAQALDAYSEMLSGYLEQVAPASLTYQGFSVSNYQRLIDPIVRQTLDGLDFLVGLFKRRGVSKILQESVKGFSIVWDPQASHHGLYMLGHIYINVAKTQGKNDGRLWKNWLQEVFLHEFGHHIEAQLSREAREVWKSAWVDVEEKRKILDEKAGVSQADRVRFFNLLASNQWNPSTTAQKLNGLDKLKFGTWLRNPDLGEPFITPNRFRFTKRGQIVFGFFSDPEGTLRKEMGQDIGPEDSAYIAEQVDRRSKRYRKILMLDYSYVMKVTDELADTLRREDKSVDEALDKLGLPSDYARTNEGEDFAESFVAFMVNPSRLSDNALFRMQQALSLSGLYGKAVMRLAARVAKRYVESGYLDIGDLILYGKFKNALGRITGFGTNDKGDPTVTIQPVDKEGNPKKGQPKELVLLKVRKVEEKKEALRYPMSLAQNVVARFRQAAENPTSKEMADKITSALSSYKSFAFKVTAGNKFGGDGVYITFASVPKGSPELDALNAKHNVMISITGGKSYGAPIWQSGGPAPDKVKAEQFRGNAKFRAKSGPPDKVVAYVIQWFKANEKTLQGE